jgi:hypothetical protein
MHIGLLVGKPEGKRQLGRQRHRWVDNIVACRHVPHPRRDYSSRLKTEFLRNVDKLPPDYTEPHSKEIILLGS